MIDDASEDGSGQRAAAVGASVLTLPRHCGKGTALQRGFAEALRRGANAVVTLDGDGQHDPRDIPRLLAASQCWPESIIIGGRLDSAEAIPLSRFYAMQVASFWINWLGHCQVRDTQSGFRLYPAAVLRTLPLRHGGFIFESEVLIKAGLAGWGVREIPIRAMYAPGRTSHYRPLRRWHTDNGLSALSRVALLASPVLVGLPGVAHDEIKPYATTSGGVRV